MNTIFTILLITLSFGGSTKAKTKSEGRTRTKSPKNGVSVSQQPSHPELCSCFDIDLMHEPITRGHQTCYYYSIDRIPQDSHCAATINYITLGLGDLTQCDLESQDINGMITEYSPKCYTINAPHKGPNVEGIQVIFDNTRSKSGLTPESVDQSKMTDDVSIFSICFDAADVDGIQSNGQIEIGQGSDIYTCDAPSILPNFCGSTDTTTAAPEPLTQTVTTPSPVTPTPTTPAPVTPVPTTPAPTTPEPTTPAPTTPAPTTPEPTTSAPTTTEPTMSPILTTCNSDDAINVGFLLDESGSVDSNEWDIIKEFVNRIITFDLSPSSYVSLFEYASIANYKQFVDWTPVESSPGSGDRSAFEKLLENNRYNPSGLTATWDAVNRVLDNYWDYRFSCSDDCEKRSDLLFLITDGEPTGTEVCPNMISRMSQSNVDIVIIGVGTKIDFSKISCLDVNDNEIDLILLPEFDSDAFNAIESRIREKTCNGLHPLGPGERPLDGTQWRYDGTIGLGPIPQRNGGGAGGAHDPNAAQIDDDVTNNHEYDTMDAENDTDNNNKYIMWIVIGSISVIVIGLVIIGGYIYNKKRVNNKQDIVKEDSINNTNDNTIYGDNNIVIHTNNISPIQSPDDSVQCPQDLQLQNDKHSIYAVVNSRVEYVQ